MARMKKRMTTSDKNSNIGENELIVFLMKPTYKCDIMQKKHYYKINKFCNSESILAYHDQVFHLLQFLELLLKNGILFLKLEDSVIKKINSLKHI